MVAVRRGIEVGEVWKLVTFRKWHLKRERDRDIVRFFGEANALHRNFYENEMERETVEIMVEDVGKFIEKLERVE